MFVEDEVAGLVGDVFDFYIVEVVDDDFAAFEYVDIRYGCAEKFILTCYILAFCPF